MDIKTDIDPATLLTTYTLRGDLDFNRLLDHIKGIHAKAEHTSSCLWDFRSITSGEKVSVLQIGRFYELCGQYFYRDPQHKIAFLVDSQMDFGLRQVMATFEASHNVRLSVKFFRNPDMARQWLWERPEG